MTHSSDVLNLEHFLGKGDPGSDGINYSFRCPICKDGREKKKKLIVRLDDGRYHCWVCESKGRNVASLIFKNVSAQVREIDFSFSSKTKKNILVTDEIKVEEKASLPEKTQLIYDADPSNRDARDTRAYIESRGISETLARRYRLCVSSDSKFRRRVIVPSFDFEGNLNYCVARTIDKDIFPKYRNSKVSKINIIFNEIDIDWSKPLTIVEGPFDLIKCPDNSTCLLGSSLSSNSKLFSRIVSNSTPVILALDPDAEEKCHKIASLFYSAGIDVKQAHVASGDIGDMSLKQARLTLQEATSWTPYNKLEFKIANIRSGSVL